MLAGAIDPVLQEPRWYHHLANTFLGRVILSKSMNVTTQEMLSLSGELEKQKEKLERIDCDITLIQGGKDWLVPRGNAHYAKSHLAASNIDFIVKEKQGHFIPWQQYCLVKEQIEKHLNRLE